MFPHLELSAREFMRESIGLVTERLGTTPRQQWQAPMN
jgi:hypothetical protein